MEFRRYRAQPPNEDLFASLSTEELYWIARQEFLEDYGYMLRPRFRPGWVPSWKGKSASAVYTAEDAYCLPFRSNVVDATRMSDGALVYIKRTPSDSQELKILEYLSSAEMRRDPRNHCVPLLDVLCDPAEPETSYIVMPFLRFIDDPAFELLDDVLECLDQVLEGLGFIHDHGVAHRSNVMMDATALFPRGFHPIKQMKLPDISGFAPVRSRTTAAAPVNYYFIDFGISTQFPTHPDSPRLVTGSLGLDREPPERSDDLPYDPFKLDVFLIGNLIRREFYDKYSNLSMLEPLMRQMVATNPMARPTAAEAFRQFKTIRNGVTRFQKYSMLYPREWPMVFKAVCYIYSFVYVLYRSLY
ncbi:hypothetical protein PYCCODRAFT_1490426 [Trametes coccinea BRFM310]|uniref:Protein kinase domain-containing protein n=1 Tax=Trametes coccinea (strain BRFM310) TaxID=1353009 RepID=A0A1Y2IR99_TRAC3|nr:hypothetical protein PYCCODRAFT_1490426 [Trametes coccinea BRFM310]